MINKRLKELRKHFNKKQNDIAEYIGVARSTYTNYESGNKKPPYEQLIKIAEFYSVSVDYLLGRTNDPTPVSNLNEDMISENIDEELSTFLKDNPEMRVAFMDFPSWSDADKQELLIYLKAKQTARESMDKK
jgi:transcriptional regulator with XRE-family HTH domain